MKRFMTKCGWIVLVPLMVFLTTLFIGFALLDCAEAKFVVDWDSNDPSPDGYRIYHRWAGESYDYTNPAWDGLVHPVRIDNLLPPIPLIIAPIGLIGEWDKRLGNITIKWVQPKNPTSEDTLYLIVRAYLNASGEAPALESLDSEEVSIVEFNINMLLKWEVLYSDTEGGPYISLGEVVKINSPDPIITKSITAVPINTVKRLFFIVRAYGEEGTVSPDSDSISVLIDRRVLAPPGGISVRVLIPVE